MPGNDFTMKVGEFVKLEDIAGSVCVVNTAQISLIQQRDGAWQVRLIDGTHVSLSEHVASAFMNRLAGMPLGGEAFSASATSGTV